MKVIHICNLPLVPAHPDYERIVRHPGRWVLNLACAQKKHASIKPECVVIVPGSNKVYRTTIDGIPVHYLPAPARGRATTCFILERKSVSKYVRNLNPDIIHAHGSEDSNLLIAIDIKLPFVFTAQSLAMMKLPLLNPPLFSRMRLIAIQEHFALNKTRFAIAKSRNVESFLSSHFPALELRNIPNTFDPALTNIPFAAKKNGIAFVGSIIPRKGFDLLRKAYASIYKSFPQERLHIIGNSSTPNTYEEKELTLLQKCLGNQLELHGILAPQQLAEVVSKCKALVAPSREEMFGNQLVEALLAGTYGIVSANTALAENIAKFGNGCIVKQNDPSSLAHAMNKALVMKNYPEQASAREKIIDNMGPAIVASEHLSFYQDILS